MKTAAALSSRTALRSASLLLGLTCAGLLGGCSILPEPKADPTRYYVLGGASTPAAIATPEAAATPNATAPTAAERPATDALRVGLRAIEVVPYLNNRSIIVRTATNEIAYQEFARWAETPASSIGRAVAERLNQSPRVERLFAQPFPFDSERDYDVSVRVTHFEGVKRADGFASVRFACEIEVTEPAKGTTGAMVLRRTFQAPVAIWDGADFGALAQALGDAANALGDELSTLLPARAVK